MKLKHTIVGLLLDIPDYIAIPLAIELPPSLLFTIPFSWILDLIGTIYFVKVLGLPGFIGAIEFIPQAEMLPTYTILGLNADLRERE